MFSSKSVPLQRSSLERCCGSSTVFLSMFSNWGACAVLRRVPVLIPGLSEGIGRQAVFLVFRLSSYNEIATCIN